MVEADFLSDAVFELFRNLIYNESGIHFTPTNRSILESRLKERLRETGVDSPQTYFGMITRDGEELKNFLDSITTNLTHFFRNKPHFDALEKYVIPELLKIKKGTSNPVLKVWSAGCSSGEEPYSIAMLMAETLPPPWKFDVVACDISLKNLLEGKKGFYPNTRVDKIPELYLRKYFQQVEDGYQIKPEIMSRVRFDYHNLMHDSGLRNIDIVFCRNVIIYFDEATQTEVIKRFWDVMSPKSFLFIGHSESLFGMDTKFEFLKTDWATLYRKFT